MALEKFHFRSVINYPAEQLFEWHLRSLAIQRRIPPWEGIEPLSFKEDLVTGEFNGVFRVKFYPFYWGKVKLKQLINKEIRLITIRAEGSIFSHFEYTTKL
ncbi:MAG: hypothetical protein HYZ47_02280, partial [Simkania negevensis]|nr:hypothetical protein [Simkania negevensis]